VADEQISTVVTKRDDAPRVSMAVTPDGIPDVKVIALPSWRIVLVRMLRVYGQAFLGFLTALMSGILAPAVASTSGATTAEVQAILPHEFWGIVSLAAQMAVAPSFITLAQNAVELLTRLDESRPQWRA
jgi:hypothetical protein